MLDVLLENFITEAVETVHQKRKREDEEDEEEDTSPRKKQKHIHNPDTVSEESDSDTILLSICLSCGTEDGRESMTCDKCEASFCIRCLSDCTGICGRILCSDCFTENKVGYSKCSTCNEYICDDCKTRCRRCYSFHCTRCKQVDDICYWCVTNNDEN